LGIVLEKLEQVDDAVENYRKALAIRARFPEAHNNLGLALLALGHLDEVLKHFRKAVEIDGRYAMAHLNLGVVLSELRQMNEAASHYRKAIDLNPQLPEAHNDLGNVLQELERLDDAISCFRKAIEVRPEFADAYSNLGNALKELGWIEEAIVHYRKTIELKPDYAKAHSNLLLALHYGECSTQDAYNEHKAWNVRHAEHLQALERGREQHPDPEKALQIGLVSPDFREHSVAYFLRSFFAARDRHRLVFFYSNTRHEDAMTESLRVSVDEWRNIAGKDDQTVAKMIQNDGVDILVDLSGHTWDNRLPLFALGLAPVQVTWLGYPDTTELAAMDYRITGHVADPPGEADDRNVEQLVRLPDGFLCYCPPDDAPDVGSPPSAAKGTVTFASFNNQTKVTPEVIKAWAQILQLVPGSELLMKCQSFDSSEVRGRYQGLFEQESVPSDRLHLVGRSPSTPEHLAMYGKAGIALDSFPYNGTTTTCEAFWMGVPVVALRGDRHAARVGASLLAQVGLDSLVGEDVDQYVEKAVSLAGDLQRIESLRAQMRTRMQDSSLCDADKFAGNLEVAFRNMWKEYCARQSG
jgi:protein O-GlcNAc transferase